MAAECEHDKRHQEEKCIFFLDLNFLGGGRWLLFENLLNEPAHESAEYIGKKACKNQTDVDTPRKYVVPILFIE
jgi:hypothetical protein